MWNIASAGKTVFDVDTKAMQVPIQMIMFSDKGRIPWNIKNESSRFV